MVSPTSTHEDSLPHTITKSTEFIKTGTTSRHLSVRPPGITTNFSQPPPPITKTSTPRDKSQSNPQEDLNSGSSNLQTGVSNENHTKTAIIKHPRQVTTPTAPRLAIDASAQLGLSSGSNSPTQFLPTSSRHISFHAPTEPTPRGLSDVISPVQVMASFAISSPRTDVNNDYDNNNNNMGDGYGHDGNDYHFGHIQHQLSATAPTTSYVTMVPSVPPVPTTVVPVFSHSPAYPTMIPVHVAPGPYTLGYISSAPAAMGLHRQHISNTVTTATATTIPAIPHTIADISIPGVYVEEGEVMDPAMTSQYQAAHRYHNATMMYVQQSPQYAYDSATHHNHHHHHHQNYHNYHQLPHSSNVHGAAGKTDIHCRNDTNSYHNQHHLDRCSSSSSLTTSPSSSASRYNAKTAPNVGRIGLVRPLGPRSRPQAHHNTVLPGTAQDSPLNELFQKAIQDKSLLGSAQRKGGTDVAGSATSEVLALVRRSSVNALLHKDSKSTVHNDGDDDVKNNDSSTDAISFDRLRGHFVALSQDQIGSRVVQTVLEEASPQIVISIFEELNPHLDVLMADQFGNYVIQRLVETGVDEVVKGVASALVTAILPYSLHVYGCRVVQKVLECLSDHDQRISLISELQPFTMHCLADQNANHVVQKCIETVQPSQGLEDMLNAISTHCLVLAKHSYGCRAVQRVLQYCTLYDIRSSVLDQVLKSVVDLTKDQFGNYVIQYLVRQGPEEARSTVLNVILPLTPTLACHKFASNVLEACLDQCPDTVKSALMAELLRSTRSSGDSSDLVQISKDQFGNYVLQKALDVASDLDREDLIGALKEHSDELKRSGYGKHIIAKIGKMENAKKKIGRNTSLAA